MVKILILGAGMMAKPLISYFAQREKYIIVADQDVTKSRFISRERHLGRFEILDVYNKDKLRKLIWESDIVISLLPWKLHWLAGRECLDLNKDFLTASYIGEDMRQAAREIEKKGLLFLNEIGLDPGLDHLMILHTIDDIRKKGGQIEELHTYGTSLPSFNDNNNPFHYKFSWSPQGFLLGGMRAAFYMENGEEKEVSGENIFRSYWLKKIPGLGDFEVFPNGNAMEYRELYRIPEVKTLTRNTLRHIDSCELWDNFKKLGLFDDTHQYDFSKINIAQIVRDHIGAAAEKPLMEEIADYLRIDRNSSFIKKIIWLELFETQNISAEKTTVMKEFSNVLQSKLFYNDSEKDMVILVQEFIVSCKNGERMRIINSLIREGVVSEESATSFLVAIPLAVAADLILRQIIQECGVKIPNEESIYLPIIAELEKNGVIFQQRIENC